MDKDPPREGFNNAVDALLRPPLPPPSATPRVAVLYSGDGELSRVYPRCWVWTWCIRTSRRPAMITSTSTRIPVFDLVATTLPGLTGRPGACALEFTHPVPPRPASAVVRDDGRGQGPRDVRPPA